MKEKGINLKKKMVQKAVWVSFQERECEVDTRLLIRKFQSAAADVAVQGQQTSLWKDGQ